MKSIGKLLALILSIVLISCGEDDGIQPGIEVPATYEFFREGESTVSFGGQTVRLNMLSEIKSYITLGDLGAEVDDSKLLDMFANENSPFADADLNSSTKDLESKTYVGDVNDFKELFAAAAIASKDVVENGSVAEVGKTGLLTRSNGKTILVNEKGWEFTQMVEKGLMGATFLNQIYNTYLTDARVGSEVDNTTIEEGMNYTAKEHHWDEAFGYWGVPVSVPAQLPSEADRFWAKYSYGRESALGSASALRDAYLEGRTAIVNDDQSAIDAARELLYIEFEKVAAATAVHYINSAIADIEAGETGDLMHHLSEAYPFAYALKFSPNKSLTDDQINSILDENLGTEGDFWTVTADGLELAKATIASAIPDLADSIDEL